MRENLRMLLSEFIAQTLSGGTSGNRTIQGAPLRLGEPIIPGADAGVISDEEGERESESQAACVLIQDDDGRVLAVSRKDDPTAFGLPGGKVDAGETASDAAVRELEEETGLIVTNLKQIYVRYDEDGFRCTTFIGKISGEINTDEGGVVRWVDPETLFAGPFGDYNRNLFKHIGRV